MKKIKYTILSLFLVTIGIGLYSCSDDMIKSDYDYEMDKSATLASVSFLSLEKIDDENISLKAEITSKGDSEIYDQGFIYSTDQSFAKYEVYSVKASAESSTTIEVEEMSLDQGQDFYFKAYVLAKDGMSTSSEVKSINLPVTWVKVGMVSLTDFIYSGETYDVELQKFEGQDRYRLVNPFDKEDTEGEYVVFTLDGLEADDDGVAPGFQTAVTPDGFTLYWDPGYVGQYCNFGNKDNVYTIEFLKVKDGSLYVGGPLVFEWVDEYPGEIPEPAVVTYKNDFSTDADRAGWVLDKFSGWGEEDDVFFFDMENVDAAHLGTAVGVVYDGDPLRIISQVINVENDDDILSFSYYSGMFESEENAKVKVYIREVGGDLDLDNPVLEYDLEADEQGRASIPVGEYAEKSIKLIFVVEQGDFLFYRLAIADTDDAGSIFK